MKVKDIMTTDLKTCSPDTTVAEAAHLMWEGDCGILPVVDEGALVGVVTDRDMYIALATQNARASQLRVGAVATTTLTTCEPEDDVRTALSAMKRAHDFSASAIIFRCCSDIGSPPSRSSRRR